VMAAAEHEPVPSTKPAPSTKPSPAKPAVTPAPPIDTGASQAIASHDFQATLQSMLTKTPVSQPARSAQPSPSAIIAPRQTSRTAWKQERLRQLRGELTELNRLLSASLPPEAQSLGNQLPAELATLCRSFISKGIRPSTADSIGTELAQDIGRSAGYGHEVILASLQRLLADRIRVSGPLLAGQGDRTVSLMIGPSGAGKTSVIAKLAAHYRLEEKKSVAIITFDTYRQASVEQLRMYAAVLGVPFASAVSARQVHEGLRRHAHADMVLIDMPGVGPEEVAAAQELHHRLTQESQVDMHLVVPASMRDHDLCRVYDRVKDLPLLRLLFTKLDETESFGTVFELAYRTGVPLSYWSAGQRVPEDIELATPERLAAFLVTQRYAAPVIGMHQSPTVLSPDMPEPAGAVSGRKER